MTDNQKMFFDSYAEGEEFIMLSGSAGTGKSYIAIYKALEEILDKSNPYNRLILIRSAVATRDIGFLKGSLEEKVSLYEDPYIEICAKLFGKEEAFVRLKEQGYIEFTTTTALRGLTFDNSIIIVDEMQNCTFQELDTVFTRTGKNSKTIYIGDITQDDLLKKASEVSGLPKFIKIAESMNEFCRIHFTSADIVRGKLVKAYIIAKEKLGF
jgi:phosphate starvation-inducible protein PhoH